MSKQCVFLGLSQVYLHALGATLTRAPACLTLLACVSERVCVCVCAHTPACPALCTCVSVLVCVCVCARAPACLALLAQVCAL